MNEVIASMSVSLDGFFTGPDPGPGQGLGAGGEVLHAWVTSGTSNREQLSTNEFIREAFERAGAMVCGRDSYDTAERAWGPEPPFEVPIFVPTHRPRPEDARKGTTFTFLDSFDAALAAAREAAGEKDVALHGGSMIRQALAAGVLHELNLQLAPVLLGEGRRLFADQEGAPRPLELLRAVEAPGAIHLRYRVPN